MAYQVVGISLEHAAEVFSKVAVEGTRTKPLVAPEVTELSFVENDLSTLTGTIGQEGLYPSLYSASDTKMLNFMQQTSVWDFVKGSGEIQIQHIH